LRSIKAICERYIPNRYALVVVDIYQQPALAQRDQVEFVPTLIKKLPLPEGRLLGDMTNQERVLLRLNVPSEE
jgi:circadian clock protein KaiB